VHQFLFLVAAVFGDNPDAAPLLCTALLWAYGLRLYFTNRSMASIFDDRILWLEHGPGRVPLVGQW
jgi:hypothetical protein